ncbi:hypothetical protein DAPPUDRAFT_258591 [Daphnia pulex]|uniref:Uncharacterized protein n=1 Tax=Daphnia pulex TaxID=6669 RepID=E9HFN7_DAPPU|nr:hypothetical protein DAPPUDRAFT_258591 [Daphnia pulex]|eukprot:EFX69457.1 hypothetical protein DAPPUDRAFT_258591 [Daphnia pulex]
MSFMANSKDSVRVHRDGSNCITTATADFGSEIHARMAVSVKRQADSGNVDVREQEEMTENAMLQTETNILSDFDFPTTMLEYKAKGRSLSSKNNEVTAVSVSSTKNPASGAEQDRNQDVGEAACGGASSTEELSEIAYSAASALSKGSAVTESIDADPDQALIHFEQSDSTLEDETTRGKERCGRNCGES